MGHGTAVERPAWLRRLVPALVVAAVLAVPTAVQTLPSPARMGSEYAPNEGDPVFLMWVLRHETDALTARPSEVFQGNIYFPHRDTIAWSDNLLLLVPVFGAASAVSGGNDVFAFNATTFLAYLAGGLAAYAFARYLLGRRAPALVAGLLFALLPYRGVSLGHLQLAGFFTVPLALLFLMQFCDRGRWRDAAGLGLAAAATWLATTYYAVLLGVAAAAFVAVWVVGRRGRVGRRFWTGLAGAGVLAAVVVAPTLPPYLRLQGDGTFRRSEAEVLAPDWSAFGDVPPSPVYRAAGVEDRGTDQGGLYPGAVTVVLVAAGLVVAVVDRRRRDGAGPPEASPGRSVFAAPLAAAMGVALLAMAGPGRGPLSLGYRAMRAVVPGFASIRDVGRFWLLPALGLAVLAGWGLAAACRRLPGVAGRPGRQAALVVAVLVVAAVELAYRPARFVTLDRSPEATAAYRLLDRLPEGPVTEVPAALYTPTYPYVAAPRQYRSLIDGNPRLEGYSGNAPPEFFETQAAASAFPAPEAVARLRSLGVRYVVVHGGPTPCDGRFGPDELAAVRAILDEAPGVARVRQAGPDLVVELAPPGAAERGAPPVAAARRSAGGCTPN